MMNIWHWLLAVRRPVPAVLVSRTTLKQEGQIEFFSNSLAPTCCGAWREGGGGGGRLGWGRMQEKKVGAVNLV